MNESLALFTHPCFSAAFNMGLVLATLKELLRSYANSYGSLEWLLNTVNQSITANTTATLTEDIPCTSKGDKGTTATISVLPKAQDIAFQGPTGFNMVGRDVLHMPTININVQTPGVAAKTDLENLPVQSPTLKPEQEQLQ